MTGRIFHILYQAQDGTEGLARVRERSFAGAIRRLRRSEPGTKSAQQVAPCWIKKQNYKYKIDLE